MAKGKTGFSYRREDATDGGGTEGALATISEIGFVDEFTYGGRQKDKPQAALRVVFAIDGFDKPWEQHYTVGPTEKYEVVADGDGIRSLGKATGLNRKSSAYRFFDALQTAAEESEVDFDELLPELEDEGTLSVRPLEGRAVRLTNVKFETVGGDTKDLIVIGTFEDDAPAPTKKNGKSTSGAKASSKNTSSEDIEEKTEQAVTELIEEHTSVKKADLGNLVYQAHKKDGDVKAMMNLCLKDSWIASEDRPWSFDKKKGVLRAE